MKSGPPDTSLPAWLRILMTLPSLKTELKSSGANHIFLAGPITLKPGITLYFARHGETEANCRHLFSGQKNTPLTARGREFGASMRNLASAAELIRADSLAMVQSPPVPHYRGSRRIFHYAEALV